jgi:hypothetical protein
VVQSIIIREDLIWEAEEDLAEVEADEFLEEEVKDQ